MFMQNVLHPVHNNLIIVVTFEPVRTLSNHTLILPAAL